MKKYKPITYLDTYCEGGYSYKDYVEDCEDNGIEPAEEDSNNYWSWIHMRVWGDVDDFFVNLRYTEWDKTPCVISGRLGLWWGEPVIENEMCDSLGEAIKKCWGSCDDIEVTLENGVVHVSAMHHDETNYFEIRPLTARGAEKMLEGEDICVGNHWHTFKFGKYLF